MKNFEKEGEVQTLTAPGGGVVSGQGYQVGQTFAVATKTVTAAEVTAGQTTFEGVIRGNVAIAKAGSQAWADGALVYWDDGNGQCTTVATGNLLIGRAVLPAIGSGSGETTGHVYLDGAARDNEAT